MGIRILATHLTCPACGSALSPLNPVKGNHCEACGPKSAEPNVSESLFTRLRGKFRRQMTQRQPRYETSLNL